LEPWEGVNGSRPVPARLTSRQTLVPAWVGGDGGNVRPPSISTRAGPSYRPHPSLVSQPATEAPPAPGDSGAGACAAAASIIGRRSPFAGRATGGRCLLIGAARPGFCSAQPAPRQHARPTSHGAVPSPAAGLPCRPPATTKFTAARGNAATRHRHDQSAGPHPDTGFVVPLPGPWPPGHPYQIHALPGTSRRVRAARVEPGGARSTTI